VSPLWAGCSIAAFFVIGSVAAWELASPIDYERQTFERRLPFVMGLSVPILFWLVRRLVRGAERDFDALRRRMKAAAPQVEGARRSLGLQARGPFWTAMITGALFAALIQQVNVQRWSRFASGDWNLFDAFSAPMVVATVLLLAQGLAVVFSTARSLGRAAGELLDVRLFDSELGRPLVRFGLRTVLMFVVLPMILFSIQMALRASVTSTIALAFAVNLVVSAAAMLLPVWHLRGRIREAKRQERARIECAVHGDRAALEASPMAQQLRHLALPELLAYRREVDAVREWPFDTPVMARLGLYVVLPPASWVAAALVERSVDGLLSR
jgi:hypothetical protein